MTEVIINSGVCGFQTTVRVDAKPNYEAELEINSTCPHVKKMVGKFGTVKVMGELFKKGESQVLAAAQDLPHIGSGYFKGP